MQRRRWYSASMLKKVYVTMVVIFRSLVLARSQLPPRQRAGAPAATVFVPPAAIGASLASLDRLLNSDFTLALFFPNCHAAAAPFVLFRLKREGYSNCTAVATPEGLLVQATR